MPLYPIIQPIDLGPTRAAAEAARDRLAPGVSAATSAVGEVRGAAELARDRLAPGVAAGTSAVGEVRGAAELARDRTLTDAVSAATWARDARNSVKAFDVAALTYARSEAKGAQGTTTVIDIAASNRTILYGTIQGINDNSGLSSAWICRLFIDGVEKFARVMYPNVWLVELPLMRFANRFLVTIEANMVTHPIAVELWHGAS